MASGSTNAGRGSNSGSKGFDFGSEDILCSYDDYSNQESSNGNHSDPVSTTNSTKDFAKPRMSRPSVFPTPNAYSQPEDSNQELVLTVERTMKKYADNLMRFLEGISSRLSQLELYCYNLDKSIGEMRSELSRDHEEADTKLKSVDKHLQEVHRSVQILRDKQELAETQKELAKLQLAQKESSTTGSHSQQEEKTSTQNQENAPELQNQQLALALPHQVAPQQTSQLTRAPEQQQSVPPPSQPPAQTITSQQQPYYMGSTQLTNPQTQPQPQPQPQSQQSPQGPYLTAVDTSYRPPQVAPPPQPNQVNQPAPVQQFPQYQQQWGQPPQTAQPPQAQTQTHIRAGAAPAPSNVYPSYIQSQPTNGPSHESLSGIPQSLPGGAVSRSESLPYGYGGGAARLQNMPPAPQHMKGGDGYPTTPGNHPPTMSSGGSYMIYETDAHRQHHPSQAHFTQGGSVYPPPSSSVSLHNQHPQPPPSSGASSGMMMRVPSSPPQFVRNHPYNELIEKMVSMGYRGDHVASVIQRLEESGQAVDFNSVLDRLNGHSSTVQRGW